MIMNRTDMELTENLWDLVEKTQKAILKRFPDRDSIARKMALRNLEAIAGSGRSLEQRIAEIYSRFPFVWQPDATDVSGTQDWGEPDVSGKPASNRLRGTLAELKSGYGFITPENGDHDYFFLWEYLENCLFEELHIGEDVEFEIGRNDRGECAVKVVKLAPDGTPAKNERETVYVSNGDVFNFFESCRDAAERGDAAAQRAVGICYMYGDDVEQNPFLAVTWYRKAAEQGNADAQWRLGVCYENGEGVKQKMTMAVKWYRLAAEQGCTDAQYRLAQCFKHGKGVEKNMDEAVKWYREAANSNHPQAQSCLGVCYYNGNGVEQDFAEAVKWFRLAAEQGYDKAQFNLGICYSQGKGVTRSEAKAVSWYRLAAEQGSADAQYRLGKCSERGDGVRQDWEEAEKWYRLAAEQGSEPAKEILAGMKCK